MSAKYRADYWRDKSDEFIEAEYVKAVNAARANLGKLYRGYRLEASMQRLRHVQMLAEVKRDRKAGIV